MEIHVSTDYGYYIINQSEKLIMVSNYEFDPNCRYSIHIQTVEEILNSSLLSLDKYLLVILIASIHINRAIHFPLEQKKYPKLTEKVIADGLKKIFKISSQYTEESLLAIFCENNPDKVEKILRSEHPVDELKNL